MTDKNLDPQPQSSAPIIPQVIQLQPQPVIPTEVLQAISGIPPSEALAKVDSWVQLDYQNRDKERSHQIELARIAQETEKLKETNRATEKKDDRATTQKNLRWGLGLFFAVFIASLGYGYFKNDSDLPKTILTLGAGLLGGTGLQESLSKNKESRKEDDKK
jgi:hypothetical protein